MLVAALEETEAKASALDLENARLRLALVMHIFASQPLCDSHVGGVYALQDLLGTGCRIGSHR